MNERINSPGWASYLRVTRSSMLDVLGEDYIRTARSKGLSKRRVVYKHAFRNAIIPVITLNYQELQLAQRALNEADGKMSIPLLVSWGLPERWARSLVESWELRGWLRQDSTRQNARYITPKLLAVLSNSQSGQTASSTSNW